MLKQSQEPRVHVEKVENKPVKGGTHKFAWLRIAGLSPDQNRAKIHPGQIGMKRVDVLRASPIEVPHSVAWDGCMGEPGLVFDGWQDEETLVLVEAWGL